MTPANIAHIEVEGSEWVRAHEALSRLAKERAAADAEEGRWLVRALRSGAHVHLGFGSFAEYVERLFGYKPRSTQEKLRVAQALEELPATARALESGLLGWCAVRELTRVAVAETEAQWLAIASGKTVRQLEELVANMSLGDDPGASRSPSERSHILRFEVAAETYALFREAVAGLRRRTDSMLDDDSVLLLMARQVLGGPGNDGQASYQVALSVCAQCGAGHQLARGQLVAVGRAVVAMARCDGQRLGCVDTRATNENADADGVHVNDNALPALKDDADAGKARAHVGAEGTIGASKAKDTHVRARAKQTIPPALRRAVLRRDHGRCRVSGCKNATFLDLHHIELRSEGGQNEPDNLISICAAHHRAAHRGELLIEGSATSARFLHADGSEYGRAVRPESIEAQSKVFSALRQLGFREGEVHAVLAELRRQSDFVEVTTERLLREALRRLAPPGVRRSHG